jgi:glycosyl transferase family 87
MTRSAVGLGTVGPLLLLATAVAWRGRDRLVEPALAVGAAVAVKLFLWPLAVWLALTRRVRAAAASVILGLALALLPWAAIGFAGITGYPSLLHKLSHQEAGASYSGYAIGLRLHLPGVAAAVLCAVATLIVLAAAARVARDPLRTAREQDVAALTLALAAAFVASPIVWIHYFLLLLVPIALTRPRLSLIWIVPFAYWPLGETAWPGADARKLGLALVVTALVIVVSVRRGAGAAAVRPSPSGRGGRREVADAVTAGRGL